MGQLLSDVLDAHGGLERWSGIQTLTARLSLGGPFWAAKGWPDIFVDETVELDAQREHIVFTPFAAADRRSVFDVDPERIVIQGADGEVVERRDNPRASFAGFDASTPWDALPDACLAETRAVWRIDHQQLRRCCRIVFTDAERTRPWHNTS